MTIKAFNHNFLCILSKISYTLIEQSRIVKIVTSEALIIQGMVFI